MTTPPSAALQYQLPTCPRHIDQRHRFNPKGEEVTLYDHTGTDLGLGVGFQCLCGAALIQAPHIGPGYQLIEPLPGMET